MLLNKIFESIFKKSKNPSLNNSSVNLNFDKELPKLNFDYRLNMDINLYNMDKLIIEIYTDLKLDGFIADYHM
jgi:hypothetical protein